MAAELLGSLAALTAQTTALWCRLTRNSHTTGNDRVPVDLARFLD